jgi:hypothetical protein
MSMFLAGVLSVSHTTRQRPLRQAKLIQAKITARDAVGLAEKTFGLAS